MITYKVCKCRDDAGKEIGATCQLLKRKDDSYNPRHGSWYGKAEAPAGVGGKRETLKVGGFAREDDVTRWFAAALNLLNIPEAGPEGAPERAEILRLIRQSRKQKAELPAYDDMRRRYRHGTVFEAGTTGEYLLSWLDARKQDLSRRTLAGYESHIRRVFLPAFGDVPLSKLRAAHVSQAFAAIDARNAEIIAARSSDDPEVRASVRGERPTGAATKQRIRATLRSALSDATVGDHPLIESNVAKNVRLPSGKRPKARVWTAARVEEWRAGSEKRLAAFGSRPSRKERFRAWHDMTARPSPVMVWTLGQLGAFLDSIGGNRLYALYHLISYRGLRRGEACGLRWADVDLDRAVITIRTQLVQNGWEVDEDEPKTDASDATVSLDAGTIRALREWREAQEAEKADWGEAWTDSGRVFTREDGTDLHPANATTAFEWLAHEADLPPIRLHDLRHGAASIARAAGAQMDEIKKLMRHSSIVITIDTYTSIFEEADRELAEKMAAAVPRLAVAVGQSRTDGLPSVSQSRKGTRGFMRVEKPSQVRDGGAPGARTQNPRIKSRRDDVGESGDA